MSTRSWAAAVVAMLVAAGCGATETEATRVTEAFLRGGPYGPDRARVTEAKCEERGDGDVVCQVTARTGTATCTTNARSGVVTEVTCPHLQTKRRR